MYPRMTLEIFEKLDLSKTDREMIYYGNLEAATAASWSSEASDHGPNG